MNTLLLFLSTLCLLAAGALAAGKHYKAHDHVGIVANTVGPFNNPTETYPVSAQQTSFQLILSRSSAAPAIRQQQRQQMLLLLSL